LLSTGLGAGGVGAGGGRAPAAAGSAPSAAPAGTPASFLTALVCPWPDHFGNWGVWRGSGASSCGPGSGHVAGGSPTTPPPAADSPRGGHTAGAPGAGQPPTPVQASPRHIPRLFLKTFLENCFSKFFSKCFSKSFLKCFSQVRLSPLHLPSLRTPPKPDLLYYCSRQGPALAAAELLLGLPPAQPRRLPQSVRTYHSTEP